MINLFVTQTVKPYQLYRLVLLFTVTLLMYVGSMAQKYVDIRTDVCARIEKRNNGNGQYGNCAGIGGNAIAENVIGTSFATIVRNKGIDSSTKTGDINLRFIGTILYPPVITRVWVGTTLTPVVVGPPPPPRYASGYTYVKYCFYVQNLPNVGVLTFEYSDPITGKPIMRCAYDGNSGDPVPVPDGICAPSVITQPRDTIVCGGSTAKFTVEASGADSYQWQVSPDNSDNSYTNVSGADYSGANTATLTIANPANYTGKYYRAVLSATSCTTSVNSNGALLTASASQPTASFATANSCGINTTKSLQINLTGAAPFTLVLSDGTTQETISNITASPYYKAVTPAATTTYSIVSVADKACSNTSASTVKISQVPTLSVANAKACTNSNSFGLSFSNAVGSPVSYAITAGTRALTGFASGTGGTATGSMSGTSGSLTITIPNSIVGTYDFNLVVTNADGCSSAVIPFTLTVYGLPTVTTTATALSVCAGDIVTITAVGANTYTWQPSTYLYNDAAANNHYVDGASATTVYAKPTVANQSTTYTVTGTDVNGCTASSQITVVTKPASASLAVSSTVSSICLGESVALSASGGYAYVWSGNGVPDTANTGAMIVITPLAAGQQTYTVTSKALGYCGASGSISITVKPKPTVSVNSISNLCGGRYFGTLTATGTGNVYTWYPIAGLYTDTTLKTAYVSGSSATRVYVKIDSTSSYTVTAKENTGGCVNNAIASVAVIRNPFTSSSTKSPYVFCNANSTTLTLTAATTSSQVFRWAYSTTGTTFTSLAASNTAQAVTGATFTIQTPNPIANASTSSNLLVSGYSTSGQGYAGPAYLRVSTVVSGVCDFNYDIQLQDIRSFGPSSIVSGVVPTASKSSICNGSSVTLDAGGVTGALQWESSTSATTGFTTITGATNPLYTVTPPSGVTTYYRVAYSTGGCAANSTSVPVSAAAPVTNSITETKLCTDGVNAASATFNGNNAGTGLTYTWEYSTTSATTGFTSIPSSNTQNYTIPNYTVDLPTWYRRVITSGACDVLYSTAIPAYEEIHNIVLNTAGTQSVCSTATPDSSLRLVSRPEGGGTLNSSYTYQWESSTTSETAGFSNVVGGSGATTTTYTPPALTQTTYYRLKLTNSVGGCVGYTVPRVITVKARPTASISPTSSTVCNGSSVTLTAVTDATSGAAFTWTGPSGTLSATNIKEVVATPTAIGANVYTVTVRNADGCTTTSGNSTITVNDVPATPTVSASTVSYCSPTSSAYNLSNLISSGAVGGVANEWYTVPSNPLGSASYAVSTPNSVSTARTYYLYARNTTSNCLSAAVPVTLNIYNVNTPTPAQTSLSYCSPATADLKALQPDSVSGTVYQWHTNNTHSALVGTPTAVGNGTYYLYRYSSAGNCYSAASSGVSVSITTTPTVTVSGNPATACAPNTINLNTVYTPQGGYTYQWHTVSSNPTAGTQVADPTRISGNGTYYLYAISGNCRSNASTPVTTTVVAPAATIAPLASLCPSSSATITATASQVNGYQWQVQSFDDNSSWTNISNTGVYTNANTAALHISSVDNLNGYKYRLELTNASCTSHTSIATLPVEGTVSFRTQPANVTAFNNGSVIFSVAIAGSATADFQWQVSTDSTTYSNITDNATYYGANSASLAINPVTTSMNRYRYRCIISNSCTAPVTSNAAILSVDNKSLPAAPNVVWYKRQKADPMTASPTGGGTLKWYKKEADGSLTALPSAPIPSTDTSRVIEYYVSQVVSGVESEKVPAIATIKPITWFGGTDIKWERGINWRGGNVPLPFDTVWIENDPTHPPTLDSNRHTGALIFGNNTPVDLNGKKLIVTGKISSNDQASKALFKGSETSELEIAGNADTVIHFVDGFKKLKNFKVNHGSAKIKLGTDLDIHGLVDLAAGAFDLNGNTVTLKADTSIYPYVAQVAPVAGTLTQTSGKWIVERSMPARRANRLMSASVTTDAYIWENWQEGANNTSTVYTNNQNPNPGYGTHITGSKTGANGLDATQTGNPSMWTYNFTSGTATSGSWVAVTNTKNTKLEAGKPYRIIVRGDRRINMNTNNPTPTSTILRSKGTIIQGDHTVSLQPVKDAWNLVGNPYPCAVDLSLITKTNAGNIIYIFDPNMYNAADTVWTPYLGYNTGNYVSYDLTSNTKNNQASDVNRYLQPGQAFYIQTLATEAASLTFRESHKFTGSFTQTFKTASGNLQKLYASLYSDTATALSLDGLAVVFDDDYSNDYVLGEDAAKFSSSFETISAQLGTDKASISKMKLPTVADSIQINISGYSSITKYALRFTPENLQGIIPYLYDRYTGIYTDIDPYNESKISFTINKLIPASIAANRFVIRFKPATTLPVDIINIKANKNGEAVNVDWTTTNEINMRNYDVERSADGKEFTRLAAVQAKGGLANSYQITDQSPLNGNNYYRIKGTDQNGTVKYSAIVKVNMSRAADIKVYPNPVKNNTIRLLTSGLPEGNYTVELVNGIGQKLYMAKLVQQQSANAIIQLPKTILPGMYSLKLSSEHTTVTTRVILE